MHITDIQRMWAVALVNMATAIEMNATLRCPLTTTHSGERVHPKRLCCVQKLSLSVLPQQAMPETSQHAHDTGPYWCATDKQPKR
jgi:hypothetical protein